MEHIDSQLNEDSDLGSFGTENLLTKTRFQTFAEQDVSNGPSLKWAAAYPHRVIFKG